MESILQYDKVCYVTGKRKGLEKHHIFGGNPNRKISEREGFWVWLTQEYHTGDRGVHHDRDLDLRLKQTCQLAYEETHSREEFRALMGKSWL